MNSAFPATRALTDVDHPAGVSHMEVRMRKSLFSLGALLAIVLGTGLVAAQPASATPTVYRQVLRSLGTGGCLDSDHGGAVYMKGCNAVGDNDFQLWNITPIGVSLFKIQNHGTGRCLHASGGWNGAGLYTASCNTGDRAVYWIQDSSNDGNDFRGRYRSSVWRNNCLDNNGIRAYTQCHVE
jgi:ricin-type beta-trefoil lectin protein